MSYILIQRVQKNHILIEKFLKMADYVPYLPTVEAICKNLSKRYKITLSSYHIQATCT